MFVVDLITIPGFLCMMVIESLSQLEHRLKARFVLDHSNLAQGTVHTHVADAHMAWLVHALLRTQGAVCVAAGPKLSNVVNDTLPRNWRDGGVYVGRYRRHDMKGDFFVKSVVLSRTLFVTAKLVNYPKVFSLQVRYV